MLLTAALIAIPLLIWMSFVLPHISDQTERRLEEREQRRRRLLEHESFTLDESPSSVRPLPDASDESNPYDPPPR